MYKLYNIDVFVKSLKIAFPSFRRKPESSYFQYLKILWTPVFTGVTTFYENIKFDDLVKRS